MIKYDIPLAECMEQLRTASDNGASVQSMVGFIEDEHNGEPRWKKRWYRLLNLARLIYEDNETPPEVSRAVYELISL